MPASNAAPVTPAEVTNLPLSPGAGGALLWHEEAQARPAIVASPSPTLAADPLALGPGPAGSLNRSWTTGPNLYFRRHQDEILALTVDMTDPLPTGAVELVTNLGGKWHAVPFHGDADGAFRLALPLAAVPPGAYYLRARYTRDGQAWFWDRAHYGYLLVDAAGPHHICLYSLLPTLSGTWRDWLAELPRLQALGCNLLHLLPLTQMDSSGSPYAARNFFAIDPAYLDPNDARPAHEQFAEFANATRAHGLGLCMDLVLNHAGVHGRLAEMRPDWFVVDEAEPDGLKRAGWHDGHAWHAWRDLGLLHYGHPHEPTRRELWDYMTAYALFWARYAYETDGLIRLDNLHSTHPAFLTHVLAELRRVYPGIRFQAELFTDQQSLEQQVWQHRLDFVLATPWEHRFVPQLREYLQYVHRLAGRINFLLPISSHDSGTPAQEFGSVSATWPRYVISALFGTGATGLCQGVEFGVAEKLSFIGHTGKLELPRKLDFSPRLAAVNHLLATCTVFQRAGNLKFVDGAHHAILGAWRQADESGEDEFLMFANLDIFHAQTLMLNPPDYRMDLSGVHLVDAFDDTSLPHGDGPVTITLGPCEVRILRFER